MTSSKRTWPRRRTLFRIGISVPSSITRGRCLCPLIHTLPCASPGRCIGIRKGLRRWLRELGETTRTCRRFGSEIWSWCSWSWLRAPMRIKGVRIVGVSTSSALRGVCLESGRNSRQPLSILIILCALLRVGQDLVGFLYRLELGRVLCDSSRVSVWVIQSSCPTR